MEPNKLYVANIPADTTQEALRRRVSMTSPAFANVARHFVRRTCTSRERRAGRCGEAAPDGFRGAAVPRANERSTGSMPVWLGPARRRVRPCD